LTIYGIRLNGIRLKGTDMATRIENQPFDTATANFKLWTGFIRNLILTTCGWTQTTDTGQTNPTTVASAPANGSIVYELYQATDTLAATKPLIVRIEYGQISALPSISITVGTGSNGTGTITNATNKLRTYTYTTAAAPTLGSTTYSCIGSGDASGFRFLMWRDFAGSNPLTVPCFFAVERARNTSGAFIGDYATLFGYGANLDSANSTGFGGDNQFMLRQQSVISAGGIGNYELAWLTFQSVLASGGLGTSVAAVPCFPMIGYLGNPSMDVLTAKGTDFAEASINSIQIYGSAHSYFFSKVSSLSGIGNLTWCDAVTNNNQAINAHNSNNQGLLFRYE
jgi:hypothetical protein